MNSTGPQNPESIVTEPSHFEEKQFFEAWCCEHKLSTTPTRATAILAAECGDLAIVQYLHQNYPTRLDYPATLDVARECGHSDIVAFLEPAYQAKKSSRAQHALRVMGLFGSKSKGRYCECLPFQDGRRFDASNEHDIYLATDARHWNWIYHQLANPLFALRLDHRMVIYIHSLYSQGKDLSEQLIERSKHPFRGYRSGQPATEDMLKTAAKLGWDIYQACLSSYRVEDAERPLPPGLIVSAAAGGNLELVRWCHEHYDEGCSPAAMDKAATGGHLSVVEFLHLHRGEGCSEWAMDWAARWGRLHVVEFFHAHRGDGCSIWAMDWAAMEGHLPVVEFLHRHRTEGCDSRAMDWAAENGHLPVVEFLYQHYPDQCKLVSALASARRRNDNDAVISYLQAAIADQEATSDETAPPGSRMTVG